MIYGLVLLCMWLARRRIMGFIGRWKFWLATAVFVVAALFQSYVVVSRVLWPPRDVVLTIAPDGIRCSGWPSLVLPPAHVQDVAVAYHRNGVFKHRSGTYIVSFQLKSSAPRYRDEKRDLDTRVRELSCWLAAYNIDPGSIERIPEYWRQIAKR
ncbi:MAG: hypothetical protein VW600_17220 [Ferrovibrio sp.]